MITEHIAWHARPGNPSAGGRAIDPFPPSGNGPAAGSGEEFLVWHEGFVQRFRAWYAALPGAQRPPASVEAWTAIPQMLRMSMLGWNARLAGEEQRLRDMNNFDSLDELGIFLEWSLHGFLHNAASNMWQEPILLGFESPRSTFFWQLHGLVDLWREQWQNRAAARAGGNVLTVDGAAVAGRIGNPGEVDIYPLDIAAPADLRIETTGPSDTVIYAAGPNDSSALFIWNDDYPGAPPNDFNARIEGTFERGGYTIYVVFFDRSQTGNYALTAATL